VLEYIELKRYIMPKFDRFVGFNDEVASPAGMNSNLSVKGASVAVDERPS
jgi:hypothetical protein